MKTRSCQRALMAVLYLQLLMVTALIAPRGSSVTGPGAGHGVCIYGQGAKANQQESLEINVDNPQPSSSVAVSVAAQRNCVWLLFLFCIFHFVMTTERYTKRFLFFTLFSRSFYLILSAKNYAQTYIACVDSSIIVI